MARLFPYMTGNFRLAAVLACALVVLCSGACGAYTPGAPEFRAFWVDTWHNGALSQAEVDKLLGVVGDPDSKGDIREANCNAVVLQVRRNCDALYPSSMDEPYMSGLHPADFNGLQAVIDAAHDTTGGKQRIEVHAWIVTFRTSGGLVYSRHSNPADPANYWVSMDSSGSEVADKALDPGHPNCEEYTVNVAMDLVNNFDIDGIHYDYVRFTAKQQGYNPTSIARYNARYGTTGQPDWTDERFKQWRRDQVTAVVRKVYAKIQTTKPWVKQSGSFVTWNPSPTASTREAFKDTRPYYDVYSDWDSWIQEGIVDMAVPMTYYDKASLPDDYIRWMNFEKDRHANRQMVIGPGTYMNYFDDAIAELLATRDPSPSGNYADGFCGYSYASPYVIDKSTNPDTFGSWSIFSPELVSRVTPSPAPIPDMPWKSNPTKGHISGTVTHSPVGKWADGATVSISGPDNRSMLTDGTGFYAFIDLTPGTYAISVSQADCIPAQRQATVAIGSVTGNMYVEDFAIAAAPIITNVRQIAIGANSATIAWTTDQASSSRVEYGLTTSYGSLSALNPAEVTSHSVGLSGLANNATYHYRVISANANGSKSSGDYTFISGSYGLTLTPSPSAGGSCTGGGWYVGGTSVTAHATAQAGYTFTSWSTDANGQNVVSTANPYVFDMPSGSLALYAVFAQGVSDIVIESEANGKHLEWYGEVGLAHSSAKSAASGLTGIGSRYGSIGSLSDTRMAWYQPALPADGMYQVWVTWGTSSSGGRYIQHTVFHLEGDYTQVFNQGSGGGLQNQWNSMGTFPYLAGESGECGALVQWVGEAESSRRLMADAAKWVYAGPFKAVNPSPENGASEVSTVGTSLSWDAGGLTEAFDVYLGASPGSMTKVSSAQAGTTYVPSTLMPSSTLYWRVDSIAYGKTTTGDTWSFATAAAPPIIMNLQATGITSNSATITWTTDQPSTTQVEYGASSAYGQSTAEDPTLLTSHSVALTGLTPNAVYHFRVKATNAIAMTAYSADNTFATVPLPLTVIVDNLGGTFTGTWTSRTDSGGWPTTASEYVYASNMRTATTGRFRWTPNLPIAGKYNVYAWYKSGADRTTSARHTVAYAGGQMYVAVVNQTLAGGQWVTLTTGRQFDAGTSSYVELGNKTGETDGTKKVVADAIKFEYAESDTTLPSIPADVAITSVSTSAIDLAWSPSTDNLGVMGYRVYRNSQIVAITSSTSFADTGIGSNTLCTYTVTAYDAGNNASSASVPVSRYTLALPLSAESVACDRGPDVLYPTDPFTFTNTGFGPGKVTSYRYVWDNSASHTWNESEAPWTSVRTIRHATDPSPWYLHAKGYNGDGVSCGALDLGPYYCGNGYDTIAEAMNNPDGTTVAIQAYKPVSAVLPDCFYIQEPDRTRGLRVDLPAGPAGGTSVTVAGKLSTADGERRLVQASIMDFTAGTPPRPMFLRIADLGGQAPDPFTAGTQGARGPYTIGLLVRVVGRVAAQGAGFFVLDDSSGATVKVYSDRSVSIGDVVGATGACGVESGARVLRTRALPDDVVNYTDPNAPPPVPW